MTCLEHLTENTLGDFSKMSFLILTIIEKIINTKI